MSIKPLGADGYLVDVRPQGRDGKRIRKKFPTKSEAQQYERWIIATQNNKEWVDKPDDRRPLSELIALWWKYEGQTMKAGVSTHNKLLRIDTAMRSPRACHITKGTWSDYRVTRIEAGVKASTINREQEAISSMFTTLIDTGNYHNENPFKGLPKMRVHSSEMGFLTKGEIVALLGKLKGSDLLAVKVCLATGARWGEVTKLRRSQIINQRVTFVNTKNSKNRTVPISKVLFAELEKLGNGPLFPDLKYQRVRYVLLKVAPNLPDGQAIHVLRHTFASHFMMNGGNILALQKILGHANIQQTMTYAHLAPDYLTDAIKFNPLENM